MIDELDRSDASKHITCNICGTDETRVWATYDDIRLMQCVVCGLIYKDLVMQQVDFVSLYNKTYWFNSERDEEKSQQTRHRMYHLEIERLQRYFTEGKIFDCGCGHGDFLSLLGEQWEKYGCDPSEFGIAYAKREHRLSQVYCGTIFDNDFPDEAFDVMYMRGVIHHMSNPGEALLRAHRLLRENGLLVITMSPNMGSICGKVFKDRFRLIDSLRHNHFFSVKTLRALLRKSGFFPQQTWYPYFGTGYASVTDIAYFIINFALIQIEFLINGFKKLEKSRDFMNDGQAIKSPAFYGNMMCIYSEKMSTLRT